VTHQELLNDWANAKIGLHFERGSDQRLETICQIGIEYAKANSLQVPERIVEEIRERALNDWDICEDATKWKELEKML
jgi:hypothetical protein